MKYPSFFITSVIFSLFSLSLYGADDTPQAQTPWSLSVANTIRHAWVRTFGTHRTQLRLVGEVPLTQEAFHTGYADLLKAAEADLKPGENYLLRLEEAIKNGEDNNLHVDLAQLQATLDLVTTSERNNKQVKKTILEKMKKMNEQTGAALKKNLPKKQQNRRKKSTEPLAPEHDEDGKEDDQPHQQEPAEDNDSLTN